MIKKLIIAAALILFGCSGERTYLPRIVNEGLDRGLMGIHWDTAKTEILIYDDTVSSDLYDIEQALEDWKATGIDLDFILVDDEDIAEVVIFEKDIEGLWGQAAFCIDQRHIVNAEVRLNTVAMAPYSVVIHQHVLCHEFGHILGLPHSEGDDSCMSNGSASMVPDEYDQEQLLERYNTHDDDLNRATYGNVYNRNCSGELYSIE